MSAQAPDGSSAEATATSLPAQVAANAPRVADQAERLGEVGVVRSALLERLKREVEWNSQARQRQFEQAVVWRRWNIALGLVAGLLAAAAGSTALFAHTPAAIIGLFATFATGSLATLNAGQRKVQSQAAACGYQEIEALASELLDQLAYLQLATALQQTGQLTARRLQLNKTAEPPSGRALSRVDRSDRERVRYGQPLSFTERSRLVPWVKRPENIGNRQAESRGSDTANDGDVR